MLVIDLIIFVTNNHFDASLNLSPTLFVAYMRNQHQSSHWIIRQSVWLLIAIVFSQFCWSQFQKYQTCYWKGQVEKMTSWKLLSWKVCNEIGKNEVWRFKPILENFWFLNICINYIIALKTSVISNLNGNLIISNFRT